MWHPTLKKDRTDIENVQRRATKLIPGMKNMTYVERMKVLHLPSLDYRRHRGDLITAYNLTRSKGPNILQMNLSTRTRGHNYKLSKPTWNVRVRGDFFSYRVVNCWNSLPWDIVNADSVNIFKNSLDRHSGENIYSIP